MATILFYPQCANLFSAYTFEESLLLVIISLDNGLALTRCQAIIWTTDDLHNQDTVDQIHVELKLNILVTGINLCKM